MRKGYRGSGSLFLYWVVCSNIDKCELFVSLLSNKASPCAAGFLLPSVSTDGLKDWRQSLFRCGFEPP